jgi:hypothetical protein
MKKWAKSLNRSFSKEKVQMAKKHMKKNSSSLAIKKMQIKTMLRFHLTPLRMGIIKHTNSNKCRQGCRKKRNPHTLFVGNIIVYTTIMENSVEVLQKTKK